MRNASPASGLGRAAAVCARRARKVRARRSLSSSAHAEALSKFEVVSRDDVAEYALSTTMFRHKATGAEVLSVRAPDDNKVFGITFRTLPKDDMGIPHILEHSVLCGSRKYPVKEPFVEMLKGSLNTFLNAFTFPDKTCYPVASQNTKDFYNLVDVYLDAVLHPKLGPDVLKQEGWHYELDGAESPLSYKGVVFNEMKGVYSSADQLHYRATQRALFRGHPIYSIDSGGDPAAIPALGYEAFEAFHKRYYHPANARIYFYGDDDEGARLAKLEEFLGGFGAPANALDDISVHALERAPYAVTETYPSDGGAEAAPTQFVSLSWLLNEAPFTPEQELTWAVLNHLLLGTAASELEQPLVGSALGSSVVGGGYDAGLSQSTFSVGLKGVAVGAEAAAQVTELVTSTLGRIAANGFDASAVEASMNSTEFALREFNTGSFPKGLSIMLAVLERWNYGRAPLEGVTFEAPLAALKARLARGETPFEDLIRTRILDNTHRVTVRLVPEPGMTERLEAAEAAALSAVRSTLDGAQLARLVEEQAALHKAQEAHDAPEALAKLPSLSLSDLDPSIKSIPIEVRSLAAGVTALSHELPTSGIVYLDVGLDLHALRLDELPLLPLLTRMLSELGTAEADEVAFSRAIGARTGGLGVSTLASCRPGDPDSMAAYLMLRGKATAERAPELFDLGGAMLTEVQLDAPRRATEMLREAVAGMEAAVVSSGHSFASARVGAHYGLTGHVAEATGGLSQLRTCRELLALAEADWPSLLCRLEAMRASLLRTEGMLLNLTSDSAGLKAAHAQLPGFVGRFGGGAAAGAAGAGGAPLHEWVAPAPSASRREGLQVPTQVNYVAKGAPIFGAGEAVGGATSVVSRYLGTSYLWDKVRVVGGAYGCSLGFDRFSGMATYASYRDPNLESTLAAYDGTGAFLRSANLGPEELRKAVIGAVGDLDSPQTADGKGYTSMVRHVLGISEESRQEYREQVLGTTRADFVEFADRLDAVAQRGAVSVVGSDKAFDEANGARGADEQFEVEAVL